MTNNKIVLGFVGPIASGKGTAAKYYQEKYQAITYRFSTILRDLLDRLYLPQSRDNMIRLSDSVRGIFGEDILAKAIAGDAAKDTNNLVVVEGIRRLADIQYLSQVPGFVLVEINADPKIRHARLNLRRENPDDAIKTFEQFLADQQRPTELDIPLVAKQATEHINNNGSLEQLHSQLDALVKKYS